MLLFHGSNTLVEKPMLFEPNRGLDFGKGFYLTSSREQADRFSVEVCNRARRFTPERIGFPTVSVFSFDDADPNDLEVLYFQAPDEEWLMFVKENRRQTYSGKTYDVICGPVANDRVFFTLQAFTNGFISLEAAIVALKPFNLIDQYCFATAKALERLRFHSSYIPEVNL